MAEGTSLPGGRRVPLDVAQRRAVLVAGDLACVFALTVAALRLGAVRSGWDWSWRFVAGQSAWFVLLGGLWVALAAANGLYDVRRAPDRLRAGVLSVKVSAQILVIWAVAYFVPPPWTLVRHVVVFFTLGAAIVMPLWRQAYAALFSRPAFRRRALIVGAGHSGREMLSALREEAPLDFDVVGFVDDDPRLAGTDVDGVPVIADRTSLLVAARERGVSDLVLAVTRGVHGELLSALLDAREHGLTVTPMPVLYEQVTGRVPIEHVGDHWAVALPLGDSEARGLYPAAKRVVDLTIAALGAVLLALVLPPAAVLIRLSSDGPVLYRQERVGRGGRAFVLFKLRTMVSDAEPDGPVWAERDDPRVTAVGRILRRTRLDELPQVLCVLRGDMSVVGPRPERPEFVATLADRIPFYRARNAVRPGLTGWATVHEGYASSAEDAVRKLQRDLYYIKHQSLALDLYIALRTVGLVLRLRGR